MQFNIVITWMIIIGVYLKTKYLNRSKIAIDTNIIITKYVSKIKKQLKDKMFCET